MYISVSLFNTQPSFQLTLNSVPAVATTCNQSSLNIFFKRSRPEK
jgi:hypothetical protein